MLRLALVFAFSTLCLAPVFAENGEILDLNSGTPANPRTPPATQSPDAKANPPKTASEVDEPGFKASVKFTGNPTPKYDQSTNNANPINGPKGKAWSVPLEEGSAGPARSANGEEAPPTAPAEKAAPVPEYISPALANAIAREKAGARPVEMIPVYRAIAKSEGESASTRYRLGLALIHGGELQNGLVELEAAIAMEPKNPKYLCDYGVAALRAGWIEKSFAACQTATSITPGSARYQSALGDVHLAAQHLDNAVESYTRAVKLDPDNPAYFYNLGLAFMRKGDFKRAVDVFAEAIRLKPMPAYYCSMGLAYENMKNHKNAIECYVAALKLDKNYAYAHYLFAGIFSDGEDPTYTNKFEAIEHAQKAVKLTDSKNAQYLMGLARAYRIARDYDRATANAKKAVELEPTRPDLRREYAEIEQSKMQGLAK